MTPPGLFIQTSQLRHQDDSLPFAETIVRTIAEMAVEPFSRQAAAVVDGARLALKSVVVGDNDAAFAGGHQLAGLKTKRPAESDCADPLSSPFAGVRVGAVLDKSDPFASCEVFQRVKIGGVTAHVHRDDCLGVWGYGSFSELRIKAV